MTFYTAADLIAQKEAGYQEARKFCERYEKALREIADYKGMVGHETLKNIAREALK